MRAGGPCPPPVPSARRSTGFTTSQVPNFAANTFFLSCHQKSAAIPIPTIPTTTRSIHMVLRFDRDVPTGCPWSKRSGRRRWRRLRYEQVVENVLAPVEVGVRQDPRGDRLKIGIGGHFPTRLEQLYEAIDLQVTYKRKNPHEADVSINPVGVNSARVRGATCSLSLRLELGSNMLVGLSQSSRNRG